MPQLGNAWHIPANPEPRGWGGMLAPSGSIVPGTEITIINGNQFQNGPLAGNQLRDDSGVFIKRASETNWPTVPLPMRFLREVGNNKYFGATIPATVTENFSDSDEIHYYLRIGYSNRLTTFLFADGNVSGKTETESFAQSRPFTIKLQSPAANGRWSPVFNIENVAVHMSVLPDGMVLIWGRRDEPDQGLDEPFCTPFILNPATKQLEKKTPQPQANGQTINLFCSGHAYLPDGRLLVVGGHIKDSDGLKTAVLYDHKTNSWSAIPDMNNGRWYPTATALPDGRVLVLAGSYMGPDPDNPGKQAVFHNTESQAWNDGTNTWEPIADFTGQGTSNARGMLELYPRVHVASNTQVFMSGALGKTYFLDTSNPGGWAEVGTRQQGLRDYCPAVMYAEDQVLFIGGGGSNGVLPAKATEKIDLKNPQWKSAGDMNFRRRHHNATLLPDGMVLVTGGTRGGGEPLNGIPDPSNGFDDLRPGQPVHIAELWNPNRNGGVGSWTEVAAEEINRCYHSTAVLLPDATVLSAGGGEYKPDNKTPNDPLDSHRNAQIFSPPYLFRGARPVIDKAPETITYGQPFGVETPDPAGIDRVSLVRLPSVTHAFDQNQRLIFLSRQVIGSVLSVTAPTTTAQCPPGHYMLFLLNAAGVPSVAKIIQLQETQVLDETSEGSNTTTDPIIETGARLVAESTFNFIATERIAPATNGKGGPQPQSITPSGYSGSIYLDITARRAEVVGNVRGTRVVVGLRGSCPYGIGACWGGAYDSLVSLTGVDLVDPVPNAEESTAIVYLKGPALPPLKLWDKEFSALVNGRYILRGAEVDLEGTIQTQDDGLVLRHTASVSLVTLVPLTVQKIQWDANTGQAQDAGADERNRFESLRLEVTSGALEASANIRVTGPLQETETGFVLHVRFYRPLAS